MTVKGQNIIMSCATLKKLSFGIKLYYKPMLSIKTNC